MKDIEFTIGPFCTKGSNATVSWTYVQLDVIMLQELAMALVMKMICGLLINTQGGFNLLLQYRKMLSNDLTLLIDGLFYETLSF